MKKLFLLGLLLSSLNNYSQYTEVINSRRPGLSQSPYAIGINVLQGEGGLFYESSEINNVSSTTGFGSNIFIRYGKFTEKLEVNLDMGIKSDAVSFDNPLLEDKNYFGLRKLTIGAKYLFYSPTYTDKSKEIRSSRKRRAFDKKRLLPAVALYAGLNTNFLGENYKQEGMSPTAAILLQNDLTDQFVLVTNLYADYIGQDNSEYGFIVTGTFASSPLWSIFGEAKGVFQEDNNDFLFGAGVAYLYSADLQFDASIRTNLNADTSVTYGGIGVSWRWDRHQDELKESPKASKGKKKTGGFLSRTFGKKKKRRKKRRK